MTSLPKALIDLIEALGQLPGVGPRSAERYAYYLLKANSAKSQKIASSLDKLHENTKVCPVTFSLIDSKDSVSPIYDDPVRDKKTIAIVAEPFDIEAIEKTGMFKGTYHVLGGLISPLDGIGPDQLHVPELISRIKKDNAKELILATNASVEGETTALYLQQQLEQVDIKITRLARGLPVGIDLEYADRITLSRALEGRQKI